MEYPFEIQVRLVIALCCIHNIIRLVSGDDIFDDLWRRENSTDLNGRVDNGDVNFKAITPAQEREAKLKRDDIAQRMWKQYQTIQRSRHI